MTFVFFWIVLAISIGTFLILEFNNRVGITKYKRTCMNACKEGVTDAHELTWSEIEEKYGSLLQPIEPIQLVSYRLGVEYAVQSYNKSMYAIFNDQWSSGELAREAALPSEMGHENDSNALVARLPEELADTIKSNPDKLPIRVRISEDPEKLIKMAYDILPYAMEKNELYEIPPIALAKAGRVRSLADIDNVARLAYITANMIVSERLEQSSLNEAGMEQHSWLGWEISIHRQTPDTPHAETLLAHWRTSIGGTDWLNELVEQGKAESGGDGYPLWYLASAETIIPIILQGVPSHKSPNIIGDDYFISENWSDELTIDQDRIGHCSPDEILLITAMDQS